MREIILQKSNFRCRENIYICRPLSRLRRLAVEYVKNVFISILPRLLTNRNGYVCVQTHNYTVNVTETNNSHVTITDRTFYISPHHFFVIYLA